MNDPKAKSTENSILVHDHSPDIIAGKSTLLHYPIFIESCKLQINLNWKLYSLKVAGPIQDLCWCDYRTQSSALNFEKNISIRSVLKWLLFRGCKQIKCPFVKKKLTMFLMSIYMCMSI